jgi:hypothetical protein
MHQDCAVEFDRDIAGDEFENHFADVMDNEFSAIALK